MRQAFTPILLDDDPAIAEAARPPAVASAQRSPSAQHKTLTKLMADDDTASISQSVKPEKHHWR
jgi:hypothetical protein